MYKYKKIVVACNFSELDNSVISYAAMLSRLSDSDEVIFSFVYPHVEYISQEDRKELRKIEAAGEALLLQKLKEKVEMIGIFNEVSNISYQIREGDVIDEILGLINEYDADLLVMGRREEEKAQNKMSSKLAAVAPCSVMIVPEAAKNSITKIIVPVDYSDYSVLAIEEAVIIAKAMKLDAVKTVHSFLFPAVHAGVSRLADIDYPVPDVLVDRLDERKIRDLEKEHDNFISKCSVDGIKIESVIEEAVSPVDKVLEIVGTDDADLVVIGSRGRTKTAYLLIGSTAEKMMWKLSVPVMIVKKKGENYGLLKALFDA